MKRFSANAPARAPAPASRIGGESLANPSAFCAAANESLSKRFQSRGARANPVLKRVF